MAPKILALREIDPPPVLAEALTAEFLRPLRIENPPAVRIARRPAGATWGGFCSWDNQAEFAEVTLHHDDPLAPLEAREMVENLRGTYLHEIAPRFLSKLHVEEIGGSHGPVFYALQLLLFFRAGERAGGRPWAWTADLYDLQDCFVEKKYTPGQALDWAFGQAAELAVTEISAEGASLEIVRKFEIWRRAMAAAPARRSAAQAREVAKEKELARLKNKLFGARIFLAISFFFCVLLISVLGFLGGVFG